LESLPSLSNGAELTVSRNRCARENYPRLIDTLG
jgi:hypothetical protein